MFQEASVIFEGDIHARSNIHSLYKDQNKMGAGADELDSLMVDAHDGTQQGGGNQEAAEVNMEATITEDDVVRAGGFGATDDIGSFLPVAVDSTDFEASLRDARDYEEPQGEVSRPGLGWEGVPQTKIEKC
ncbi:uncharacterized protein LOC18433330 isoform X2 [Amborella trichopoda]|uniref:uncharacterized protein LOC18433330 isoform X2 n=1 Tax=Amborella trichopoda TaxID=13333 RepID=UPI0009BFC220|nr:uncharacterized protein LOC18433330 isoform X2 [Amborella trichopoda]|eukprot:XP_020522237.1 uncharacterized protein LOC18433330 isoform X2 [Amborella trichopoda]